MIVKKLKLQLFSSIMAIAITLVALVSSTYAWFVINNKVNATTSTISATTNGFILQIAKASEGAQHGGNQTSLAASETGHMISPASSDNLKDWYVCREWNGEGKVTSYIKPEFEGHKIAGEYGDANDLHYAFIKSEYILYTITESGYADVYLDPSDGGAITVTTDGTATTDTIPKSMRVGITTQATDASGNDVGEETLKVVYAPYAETGKGNDKDAIDGWTCIAAEGSASKLKKVSYPYIYDTTYTDQNNKNWAAIKNGDAYEVAEGTNPIATSVGYDGIKVRIYIWMEGTDADCVNNAAAEDTATYNVSVKFAGVPAGTSKAGTSTDSVDAQ